ncbi:MULTISPECIES: ribosomal L7Ae/L30e/S12e/Gadd45 family protein [unclassified Ruminococcus]|uniref:L7Ae/L30e/S12e/Gadd45 family ribosomal protein n=1 Tax=unclassified Ruminococcus TaxID=2608920 RepID=UPI00210DC02D|nr:MULTISPECIES: ribosomal L7Ae/L30e/S12e/Gadd45 family protein [unclassified Ruminococcus]MCQ4021979.1 50S ribosomal protein L7ae [Ruminococcus sp. zg-924]MCQ4114515.1 50S ribosomal protein L7ae [Ruminococcus sp. zg-921]
MNDRFLSLLGLCRRAGKITIGSDPTIESVKKGEARLVLFAKNASANTRKNVLGAAIQSGVKVIDIDYDKEDISVSLGKLCAVASVNDEGFAKKLLSLAGEKNGEECNLC